MFIKGAVKPNVREILKELPPPPPLRCNKCGVPMSSEPRILWGESDYDPIKEGWEFDIIADNYHCKLFHNCNPNEWYSAYENGSWSWYQSSPVP